MCRYLLRECDLSVSCERRIRSLCDLAPGSWVLAGSGTWVPARGSVLTVLCSLHVYTSYCKLQAATADRR